MALAPGPSTSTPPDGWPPDASAGAGLSTMLSSMRVLLPLRRKWRLPGAAVKVVPVEPSASCRRLPPPASAPISTTLAPEIWYSFTAVYASPLSAKTSVFPGVAVPSTLSTFAGSETRTTDKFSSVKPKSPWRVSAMFPDICEHVMVAVSSASELWQGV